MSKQTLISLEQALNRVTILRAKAYVYLYEEISKVVGEKRAKEICSNTTYRLGTEIFNEFSKKANKPSLTLAELSTAIVTTPEHGTVYKKEQVISKKNNVKIKIKNCPLVQTWREMGLSTEKIKLMCDIAHQIDIGTIKSAGYDITFPFRISTGEDSCTMEIKSGK